MATCEKAGRGHTLLCMGGDICRQADGGWVCGEWRGVHMQVEGGASGYRHVGGGGCIWLPACRWRGVHMATGMQVEGGAYSYRHRCVCVCGEGDTHAHQRVGMEQGGGGGGRDLAIRYPPPSFSLPACHASAVAHPFTPPHPYLLACHACTPLPAL